LLYCTSLFFFEQMKFLFALCLVALAASTVSAAYIKSESFNGAQCGGGYDDAVFYFPTGDCIIYGSFSVKGDCSGNTATVWAFNNPACNGTAISTTNYTSGNCTDNASSSGSDRYTCNSNPPGSAGGQRLRRYDNSTCTGTATAEASFTADTQCNKVVMSLTAGPNPVVGEAYIKSTASCAAGTSLSATTYLTSTCNASLPGTSLMYFSASGVPGACTIGSGLSYYSFACSSAAALVAGPVAMLVALFAIFSQKMF
jgi:hypothetical protein